MHWVSTRWESTENRKKNKGELLLDDYAIIIRISENQVYEVHEWNMRDALSECEMGTNINLFFLV